MEGSRNRNDVLRDKVLESFIYKPQVCKQAYANGLIRRIMNDSRTLSRSTSFLFLEPSMSFLALRRITTAVMCIPTVNRLSQSGVVMNDHRTAVA
jgi:hypothetical protein